jgi:DNA replication protein DnaC
MLSIEEQRAALIAAYDIACAYVEQPRGWLYLYGPPGSGKTRLAACIANELASRGIRTTYASTPGLIAYIQAGFPADAVPSAGQRRLALQRVPLLVLDDLGTEHVNEFSRAELGDLLNQRYNRELPTIITSNEWYETLPVRLADRIAGEAKIVYLTVRSYRRLKGGASDA